MKQAGHYGVALLVYAPVAFVVLHEGNDALALVGGVVALTLAMTPDVDRIVPSLDHRGPTHSVAFALFVGAVAGCTGWIAGTIVDPATAPQVARFAFSVATLSVASHLLADVVTPMGIRPLWPLSDRRFTLALVPAKHGLANRALLALGTCAVAIATYATRSG